MRAPSGDEWLQRAAEAFERGDLDGAEEIARERLDAVPRDERAENVLDEVALARSEGPEGPPVTPAGAPGVAELASSVSGGSPRGGRAWGELRPDSGTRASDAERPGLPAPPPGVVVLAGVHAAGAVLLAVSAFAILLTGPRAIPLALLLLALAGVSFLLARGLWRSNRAAWAAALAVQVAAFVANLPGLGAGDPQAFSLVLVNGVLITILLLSRRKLFAAARHEHGGGDEASAP